MFTSKFRLFVHTHFVMAQLSFQEKLLATNIARQTGLAAVYGLVLRQLFTTVEF